VDLLINALFEDLCVHVRETAKLASLQALAEWDERTYMPRAAGEYRAEQVTLLARLVHQRQTDPRLGEWLAQLSESPLARDPHSDTGCTIRQLRRDYDRLVKLPPRLVEELTRTAVRGQQVWDDARANNDYASFAPLLAQMVRLKQEQADALGYSTCRYDALLDEYEPGETTAHVAKVLEGLREQLVPLVASLAESGRTAPVEILRRKYPVAAQAAFGKAVAAQIGFDFSRGRLDITTHPFCTNVGPHDSRILTRYDENDFSGALFGILHEAGHGSYDQGLRTAWFGLPPGSYVSLGIHESQSRLWENLVGRSQPFWECFYADARQRFQASLGDVPLEDFYFAINDVRPSLIRVEADEATYNLHIIVRFEIEQALVDGQVSVADLPELWNDKYDQYLGIKPPDDASGVLQDIHWSAGLFGYFPTYALGNLYASQLYQRAEEDLGGLAESFRDGRFEPLLHWLRERVHVHGQCHSASELLELATGQALHAKPLMNHLNGKLAALYGIEPG
jgi:carboxypeptidase Taq